MLSKRRLCQLEGSLLRDQWLRKKKKGTKQRYSEVNIGNVYLRSDEGKKNKWFIHLLKYYLLNTYYCVFFSLLVITGHCSHYWIVHWRRQTKIFPKEISFSETFPCLHTVFHLCLFLISSSHKSNSCIRLTPILITSF